MDSSFVVGLISALLAGGTATAFFQYLASRSKAPIEREAATIAAVQSSLGIVVTARDIAVERITALEEDSRVIKGEVLILKSLFNVSVLHIKELWKWIAAGATPPAPTLPVELHELIELPALTYVKEEIPGE